MMLAATACLTTGCAGGGLASRAIPVASATKAQLAFAEAINLRPGDAPGLLAGRRPVRYAAVHSGPLGSGLERCDGSHARADEVLALRSQSLTRTRSVGGEITLLPIE